MSVKLGRYVFRRIGGRIVPIRLKVMDKLLDLEADKHIIKAYHNTKTGFSKLFKGVPKHERLGRGITFDVKGPFSSAQEGQFVLKFARPKKDQFYAAKSLKKQFPGIENPAVRHVALGNSLPNYGLSTIESKLVRISGKDKFAVLQGFHEKSLADLRGPDTINALREHNIAKRNAEFITKETGLNFDVHLGNLTKHGALRDTALAGPPKIWNMRKKTSQELFEHIGREVKRPDYISRVALFETESKKAVKKINALMKQGYRFKKTEVVPSYENSILGDAYRLASPAERISEAKSKGVRFVKKNGKIIPKRPSK